MGPSRRDELQRTAEVPVQVQDQTLTPPTLTPGHGDVGGGSPADLYSGSRPGCGHYRGGARTDHARAFDRAVSADDRTGPVALLLSPDLEVRAQKLATTDQCDGRAPHWCRRCLQRRLTVDQRSLEPAALLCCSLAVVCAEAGGAAAGWCGDVHRHDEVDWNDDVVIEPLTARRS